MITGSYLVKKGDYLNGGQVSSKIKEILSKLGIASEIIRRVIIAVYEAEMNVIIHSYGGEIQFFIDEEKIEIIVKDTGPGIPRIDLAIQEGYSTAPEEAREMGFGAGMGLPNIKKNSDYFTIHSEPTGTVLKIRVFTKQDKDYSSIESYVRIESEKCKRCLRCITRCPTKAIRLYENEINILSHRCINCNECIRICPTEVFGLKECMEQMEESILIAPSPWIVSALLFSPWKEFEEALKKQKNITIYPLALWEDVLRKEVQRYIQNNQKMKYPVILPVCPAVVYWIQTEYPALVDNIAPYLGPLEMAINSFQENKKLSCIPSCPAQLCALYNNENSNISLNIISPQKSLEILMDVYKGQKGKEQQLKVKNLCIKQNNSKNSLTICGIEQVRIFLEHLEKNKLPISLEMVELYACYNGCFGSPYWLDEPTIAKMLFDDFWNEQKQMYEGKPFDAIFRVSPIKLRKGIRLDGDIQRAMRKLSEIEKMNKLLPGYDCGVCGAPNCLEFAEDIVLNQKDKSLCPFVK